MKKIIKNGKCFFVNNFYCATIKGEFWKKVANHQWENNSYRILQKLLDKDHSYIDIGAWIGPLVLYGCQIAKHCYAIEPDPVAFKILKDNIELNPGLKHKITLYNGAIGNVCGDIQLGTKSDFGDSQSSIVFAESEKSLTVKSITLERFIQMNNIQDCNFIKMDIEGGEAIALPNMKDYLKKNKPALHLSLHPGLFKNTKEYSQAIFDVLTIYRNIWSDNGKSLNLKRLSDLLFKEKLLSIVAIDTEWTYWDRLFYRCNLNMSRLVNKISYMFPHKGDKNIRKQKVGKYGK